MKMSAMWSILLSMCTAMSVVVLIFIGATYVNFKNSFVFSNVSIVVANNPVEPAEGIQFEMVADKRHECNSSAVYGLAHSSDNPSKRPLVLNVFTRHYIQNTSPGKEVANSWTLQQHPDMAPGTYNVTMVGNFNCKYLMFSMNKVQTFSNIHLVIKRGL